MIFDLEKLKKLSSEEKEGFRNDITPFIENEYPRTINGYSKERFIKQRGYKMGISDVERTSLTKHTGIALDIIKAKDKLPEFNKKDFENFLSRIYHTSPSGPLGMGAESLEYSRLLKASVETIALFYTEKFGLDYEKLMKKIEKSGKRVEVSVIR